ncbi:MAG: hypothetical protein AAF409_14415 [Pseudomonadota bacterium]
MKYELAEADPKNQIVITLHEAEGHRLNVRAVEMFIAPMRMRLSTTSVDTLDTVFHREIAETLRRVCAGATLAKQIINVPDFVLRFRGLSIRGYTLLVHTMEDGVRQFIVRLKRGVGNALALFRSWDTNEAGLSILPANSTNKQIDSGQLFDEMLSHLYLPLINLNNYLRQSLDGRQDMHGAGIGSSVVQLKTKAEVLQFAFDRLISEMMLDKYARPQGETTLDLSALPAGLDEPTGFQKAQGAS